MWIVDILNDRNESIQSLHLIAGTWTIGRKSCDLNFSLDRSISRTHAVLEVGALDNLTDSTSRPTLTVSDRQSKFGTYLNTRRLGDREDNVPVRTGDLIRLGSNGTCLRVRHLALVGVLSRVHRSNKAALQQNAAAIGMHLLKSPSRNATHCVMDPGPLVATVKVLWALVNNQSIISTKWVEAVRSRSNVSDPLPLCENFLPMNPAHTGNHSHSNTSSNPSIHGSETGMGFGNDSSAMENYLPNPLRPSLYKGKAVLFFAPSSMRQLIEGMGGVEGYVPEDFSTVNELMDQIRSWKREKLQVFVVRNSVVENSPKYREWFNACLEHGKCMETNDHSLAGSVIFSRPLSKGGKECTSASKTTKTEEDKVDEQPVPNKVPGAIKQIQPSEKVKEEFNLAGSKNIALDEEDFKEAKKKESINSFSRLMQSMRTKKKITATQDEDIFIKKEVVESTPRREAEHREVDSIQAEVVVPETKRSMRVASGSEQDTIRSNSLVDSRDSASLPSGSQWRKSAWRSQDTNSTRQASNLVREEESVEAKSRKDSLEESEFEVHESAPVEVSLLIKRAPKHVTQVSAQSQEPRTTDTHVVNFKRFKKGKRTYCVRDFIPFKRMVLEKPTENDYRVDLQEKQTALERQEALAEELFAMKEGRRLKTRRKIVA